MTQPCADQAAIETDLQNAIARLRRELSETITGQPCGHAMRFVVSSGEGTSYCQACVDEGKARAELAQALYAAWNIINCYRFPGRYTEQGDIQVVDAWLKRNVPDDIRAIDTWLKHDAPKAQDELARERAAKVLSVFRDAGLLQGDTREGDIAAVLAIWKALGV